MFEIFSTREIATLVWFAALIVYVTVRSNGKMPFRDFLKALCNKLFIIPVLFLLVYAALLVYGLSQFPFWDRNGCCTGIFSPCALAKLR